VPACRDGDGDAALEEGGLVVGDGDGDRDDGLVERSGGEGFGVAV
jgi:hypothetical protein